MTTRDRLLALLVAACWGLNFPATHLALEHFPPFLMVAVRFAVIAVPVVLFVPRPDVEWRWLVLYGTGFGVVQYALLYAAMAHGMPSGLASLVLQASAPFTVLIGAVSLHERVSRRQLLGIGIALAGLAVIAVHRAHGATFVPVLLTVAGGLGWAVGNVANRRARSREPYRLVLWMSVVPPVPMAVLSLLTEGPSRDAHALATAGHAPAAVLGLVYIVLVATLVATGLWSSLMARNPASRVAPFSMAVPAVGLAASWAVLGERVDAVEVVGAVVVIGGVLVGSRATRRDRTPLTVPAAGTPAPV